MRQRKTTANPAKRGTGKRVTRYLRDSVLWGTESHSRHEVIRMGCPIEGCSIAGYIGFYMYLLFLWLAKNGWKVLSGLSLVGVIFIISSHRHWK